MSRYEQVLKNTYDLFDSTEPVHIVASALLRDTVTFNYLAQLKLRNDSEYDVQKTTVVVVPFDANDIKTGDEITHVFEQSIVEPDASFGSKEAIPLLDVTEVSSFHVTVKEVLFSNGLKWSAGQKLEEIKAERNQSVLQSIKASVEQHDYDSAIGMVDDLLSDEEKKETVRQYIFNHCTDYVGGHLTYEFIPTAERILCIVPEQYEKKQELLDRITELKKEAEEKKQKEKKKYIKIGGIAAGAIVLVIIIAAIAGSVGKQTITFGDYSFKIPDSYQLANDGLITTVYGDGESAIVFNRTSESFYSKESFAYEKHDIMERIVWGISSDMSLSSDGTFSGNVEGISMTGKIDAFYDEEDEYVYIVAVVQNDESSENHIKQLRSIIKSAKRE